MLKISKLADYSTVIMSFLASQAETLYSAAMIAKKTQIGLPTVSKILKRLNEARLLISTRGVNGGYQLARDPRLISLAEIIAVMDGKPAIIQCGLGDNICGHDQICGIRHNWQLINRKITHMLESLSLADMSKPLMQIQYEFPSPQYSGRDLKEDQS